MFSRFFACPSNILDSVPLSTEHANLWNMLLANEKPTSESDLLELLAKYLATRLPDSWRTDLAPEPHYGRLRPDALLRITAPDGASTTILVEAKTTLNARDVPAVLSQLETVAAAGDQAPFGPPLVISRYIAPRPQAMLT